MHTIHIVSHPTKAASTTAKVATETAEAVAGKSIVKSIIKKLPLLSVFAGIGFGAQRLSDGEYHKAYLEVLSGILGTAGYFSFGAGTAGSLAIDAGLLADDLGISIDDAKKLILKGGGKIKGEDGGTLPKSNSYTQMSVGEAGRGPNGGGILMAPQVISTVNPTQQSFSFCKGFGPNPFEESIITIQ